MKACASLGPVPRANVIDGVQPFVLINDTPEPRLSVESFKVRGPLDLRTARIMMDEPVGPAGVPQVWLNALVAIAWPVRLNDDETAWPVLMRGELKQVQATDSSAQHDRWYELSDLWGQAISQPLNSIPQLNPAGSLITQPYGALMIGREGNRSADRFTVNGEQVHVIQQESGLMWTVQSALEYLSASGSLDLLLTGLPREIAHADLDDTIDLTKPLDGLLENMLTECGLVIQRDIARQGGSISETRAVRPTGSGRPIRVVWANGLRPLGDALKISVDRPAQPAQLWTARAGGWVVESTFELVGGWAPALEGQADDEYDESLSSDFATYADVYRNWVLNEDGFYTQPLFNRGPAYDLALLFGEPGIDPQPIALQPNLTLDDKGSPLDPIVQMSTDSGSNWSVFPKSSTILKDRAGVYLDSQSLPTTFLAAAKAGSARLRATASLRSPLPVEQSRWKGNAFTSILPPRVVDLAETHLFHRVDQNSIHYDNIHAGALVADEVDDSHRLLGSLVKQMDHGSEGGRATLDLSGAWPLLRVGDCLREIRGPGVAADGWSQALTRRGAVVVGLETCFMGRRGGGGTTRIDLTF